MAATTMLESPEELGVPREALPRHVAVIMDGNGRWARGRGLPRLEGHRNGARAVGDVVEQCARFGIECLTLYSFSLENWKRPPEEVAGLMALYAEYLSLKRPELMQNGIRLVQIGRQAGLPAPVLDELGRTMEMTRDNQRMTLCLALNYGSRAEIIDCVRGIAERVQCGALQPRDIDEQVISRGLYTAGLPDPDLVIRTAGEMRLSNFLLWQLSYAELYVTPVLWPDFGPTHVQEALRNFALRERRYGDVPPAHAPSGTPGADESPSS